MITKAAICFVGTLIRLEGGKNGRETKKCRNRLFCGDWRSGGSVNFDDTPLCHDRDIIMKMADRETEEWAQKSRQIEAERMKAAKAIAEEKLDKVSVAFLDSKETKVKGWSNDSNVILATTERIGNRALVLAICGVVLGIIGWAGGAVSSTNKLGMGSVMISGLPSGIGFLCMGLAVLMAMVAIGGEMYRKIKQRQKIGTTFWTALSAVIVVILYFVVQRFMI